MLGCFWLFEFCVFVKTENQTKDMLNNHQCLCPRTPQDKGGWCGNFLALSV